MGIGDKYARIVNEGANKLEEIFRRAKDRGAKTIILYYSDAIPTIVSIAFTRRRLTERDLLYLKDWEETIMDELTPLAEEVLQIARRLYSSGIDADKVITEVAEKVGLNCVGYV